MRHRILAIGGLLLVAASAGVGEVAAQGRYGKRTFGARSIGIGARFGRDFEFDGWTVGGQLRFPIGSRLELIPSGDVFLGDGPDWQGNLDAAISPGKVRAIYGGAGLAVFKAGDTDTGLNLFVGLQNPGVRIPVRTFIEARWTKDGGHTVFRLVSGLNIPLNR